MELDWRYTDKHYPWQKVTKERLQAAYDELLELGFPVSIAESVHRDRIVWWVGAASLGYEFKPDGEFYLHPFHMDAHELESFEPMEGFEYLRLDSLATQMKKSAS